MKHILTFVFLIALLNIRNTIHAQEANNDSISTEHTFQFPKCKGLVNDFENILTKKEEKKLHNILKKYELKTSNEICIVTVDSIGPYDNFADYTKDLGNTWGIGKKNKDNGLLIVLSKTSREVRIGTGYGTEKILTDNFCKSVVNETMIPEFKKGNYFTGLKEGVDVLIQKWD